MGESAYIMKIDHNRTEGDADSDDDDHIVELKDLHMTDVLYKYESSLCSSTTDGAESHCLSPIPDDANSKRTLINSVQC